MSRTSLLLVALALTGCASSPTPNYDARFGDAVRQARIAQTLNPLPAATVRDGMDGRAAKEATDKYVSTFKAPPPPINVINIGGGISGN